MSAAIESDSVNENILTIFLACGCSNLSCGVEGKLKVLCIYIYLLFAFIPLLIYWIIINLENGDIERSQIVKILTNIYSWYIWLV